jgi:hypothetical protein
MKEDQRKQNEQFSEQDRRNYVIMIAELILTLCPFFQENKTYGVKKSFALILCLPATVHHVATKCNQSSICFMFHHISVLVSHIIALTVLTLIQTSYELGILLQVSTIFNTLYVF